MKDFSDLRVLNVFTTVFKQRSISGASRILNITQPSVTRSIQNLEDSLGVKLFTRTSDGLIPTDFSYNLYKRALSIYDEVDSIYADAEHFTSNKRNLINIGLGSGCCLTFGNSLTEYCRTNREAVFNIKIASAKNLLGDSENGLLDVIIGYKPTVSSANWLTLRPYLSQKVYYIARRNHPVFSEPPENQIKEIQKYPEITYHLLENSHGTRSPLAPVIRMNDFLLLFENLSCSDHFLLINEELLGSLEKFNLAIVGDSLQEKMDYVIAYDSSRISDDALTFIEFLQNNRPAVS